MSSAPTAEQIARDATWLVQALDPAQGVARLVAMDREAYRAASFLDDRMLQLPVDAQYVAWPDIEAAMASELRNDARWIFHIGHVGSTLVSQLLGELDDVLSVREPRLLRDLAFSPPEIRRAYLKPVPKLMSRTFAAEQHACVKATSFASEIADQLMPAGARALFMYATPEKYVASILAGENNLTELRMLAESRAARLATRGISTPPAHHEADLAATSWACEMTALELAGDQMSEQAIAWSDFDRALDDLPGELARVAAHFDFAGSARQFTGLASGPLLGRYSKAPDHDYSPALRRALIEQAERNHRTEIRDALAMLERAAQESPLLARALSRSTEA